MLLKAEAMTVKDIEGELANTHGRATKTALMLCRPSCGEGGIPQSTGNR
jgi:hypothetical protein